MCVLTKYLQVFNLAFKNEMNNPNIILQDSFEAYLKFMLLLLPSVIILGISEKLNLFSHPNKILIMLGMIIGFITILAIAFSKKGVLIANGNIFKTYFFNGRIIYKIQIERNNKNVISVIDVKATPALGYSITDDLNFRHSMKIFKIFFFDKNHSEKELIISVNSKENSEKTINFLTKNYNCVFETYNPKRI